MDRGKSAELCYHRRRAADEQGRCARATDFVSARCHRDLAALHAKRAQQIEQELGERGGEMIA